MTEWLLSREPALRLGSFVAAFAIMALWEIAADQGGRGWFDEVSPSRAGMETRPYDNRRERRHGG